jgi:hypothetical protein
MMPGLATAMDQRELLLTYLGRQAGIANLGIGVATRLCHNERPTSGDCVAARLRLWETTLLSAFLWQPD